jgi:hypothetical protein
MAYAGWSALGNTIGGSFNANFMQKAGGGLTFAAISGGVGAELSGGNFWKVAITGLSVAALNHVAHETDKQRFWDAQLKKMFDAYPKGSEVSASELYEQVGGPLLDWYKENPEALANTCAMRLSVALNEGGFPIPETTGTYKGANNKNYFITVKAMTAYLKTLWGTPQILKPNYVVKNAIIWQSNCGWTDATGHLDIVYRQQTGTRYYDNCGTVHYWH